VAMIGSGIMVLIVIFVPAIRELIISKATLSDFSGNIRLIIWRETIQMLKDHPLLGGGLANYKAAIAPYHHALKIFEVYPHAHQFLLIIWSELGVGGVMVFLLISLKKVFDYWHIRLRENKELYLILLISFVAMWIHGLVDSPYFKYDLSFLWWTMIALGVVTIRSKEKLFD
jgi:putative inorganic carbon (HCO3(-)) transporter